MDMFSAGVMLGELLLDHDPLTGYLRDKLGREDVIAGEGVHRWRRTPALVCWQRR